MDSSDKCTVYVVVTIFLCATAIAIVAICQNSSIDREAIRGGLVQQSRQSNVWVKP